MLSYHVLIFHMLEEAIKSNLELLKNISYSQSGSVKGSGLCVILEFKNKPVTELNKSRKGYPFERLNINSTTN